MFSNFSKIVHFTGISLSKVEYFFKFKFRFINTE